MSVTTCPAILDSVPFGFQRTGTDNIQHSAHATTRAFILSQICGETFFAVINQGFSFLFRVHFLKLKISGTMEIFIRVKECVIFDFMYSLLENVASKSRKGTVPEHNIIQNGQKPANLRQEKKRSFIRVREQAKATPAPRELAFSDN